MLLTPQGRVDAYFYGIDYPSARCAARPRRSLRRDGLPRLIDAVLLYCYHYDPSNGQYGS